MLQRSHPWLLGAFASGLLSCYSPDLATQVYRCDRGKCPEGLYCNDGSYCSTTPTPCRGFGIELASGIALCLGAGDQKQVCAISASNDKCTTLSFDHNLCPRPDALTTGCLFCCTN
jgi:hypothetical protein